MYRKKLSMLFAEALGTAVLTLIVLTVSQSPVGLPYFTSIAAAVTVGTMILVIGNASGSHLNPAITLGFWSIGKIPTLQAIAYGASQILGALSAWRLYEYLTKRAIENIAGKNFDWRVLVAEGIGALVLTFVIAAVVLQGFKGLRQAAAVGAALFIGIVIASTASNGIINPAVAIGIRSLSRAYILGPLAGGIIGMYLYKIFFGTEPIRIGMSRRRSDDDGDDGRRNRLSRQAEVIEESNNRDKVTSKNTSTRSGVTTTISRKGSKRGR